VSNDDLANLRDRQRRAMPVLSDDQLASLRDQQMSAARVHKACTNCTAQVWPNYCRECDEHFEDGHWPTCPRYAAHSKHRRY